jgi:hypothetical protein
MSTIRKTALWLVIIAAALLLYQTVYRGSSTRVTDLAYKNLVARIENKEVKRATIKETQITGELINGENFKTDLSNLTLQATIAKDLVDNGAHVTFGSRSSN